MNQPLRTPTDSKVETRHFVTPGELNSQGKLFGGQLVAWIDLCGAMCAIRHSHQGVVTASMEKIDFLHPVQLGQMVVLHGQVHWTGTTSLEVGVDAFVEDLAGQRDLVARAILTFVAVDPNGNPLKITPLQLTTPEERARFDEGQSRAVERRERRHHNSPQR